MLIISVEMMKTIDERETQKKKIEKSKGGEAIVKGWELNDFLMHLS